MVKPSTIPPGQEPPELKKTDTETTNELLAQILQKLDILNREVAAIGKDVGRPKKARV